MAAKPPIVTRSQWGARTSIPGGRGVAASSRRFYVVHWPVMSARDERQWCRDVEAMHRNQGWGAAPGYNFLIGQSGTIYEGCGRDVRGIHSPPHNTDGWGVCHLQPSTGGGSPTAPMSDAMKSASVALYNWLGSVAGRQLNRWYHGKDYATACPGPDLRNWVNAGMPAKGGAAPSPEQPPKPEEVEMIASGLASDGTLHVFVVGPAKGAVWLTFQKPNSNAWQGGKAGKQTAGLFRLFDVPKGRTIRGLACSLSTAGAFHLFVTLDDASTLYSWQRKGETSWQKLQAFAPKP
jgi:N-acetylmuramoyl-L-alanine amidase